MAVVPITQGRSDSQTDIHSNTQAQVTDIDPCGEEAACLPETTAIENEAPVRGASVALAISLDEHGQSLQVSEAPRAYRPHREPMHRDSLKRREALLKGKEGSRRRTRWENDRLLNNPWAQPPLPSDWEVHPTYPKHNVPYYLAPLWDQDMAARVNAEKMKRAETRKAVQSQDEDAARVTRDLREKLKKAKAAKGLLKDLEEQVRLFVKDWEDQSKKEILELDSDEEEIVFVGRNGQMQELPPSPRAKSNYEESDVERDRLVLNSPANDQSASFGRWLVHSIASYYGLRTWSITVGDPARREAYIGIPSDHNTVRHASPVLMPRPLYAIV